MNGSSCTSVGALRHSLLACLVVSFALSACGGAGGEPPPLGGGGMGSGVTDGSGRLRRPQLQHPRLDWRPGLPWKRTERGVGGPGEGESEPGLDPALCGFVLETRLALDFDDPQTLRATGVERCDASSCESAALSADSLLVPVAGAGRALVVEGAQSVRVPLADALNLDRGGVALWVSPLAADEDLVVLETEGGHDFALSLSLAAAGQALVAQVGNAMSPVTLEAALDAPWQRDSWHHVAVGWSAERLELWLDGRRVASATRPSPVIVPARVSGHLTLASSARDAGVVPSSGQVAIDQLRSFDGTPTAGALAALMAQRGAPTVALALDFEDPLELARRAACVLAADDTTCLPALGTPVAGRRGLGLAGGPDARLRVPATRVFDADAGSLTFWLAPGEGFSSAPSTLAETSDDGSTLRLVHDPAQGLIISAGGEPLLSAATTLEEQRWHHVALTWGEDSVRLYVDGSLAGAGARGGLLRGAMPQSLVLLGAPMTLDALRAWHGALEADAVMAEASRGPEPSPRLVLDFDGEAPTGLGGDRRASCVGCRYVEGRRGRAVETGTPGGDAGGLLFDSLREVISPREGTVALWVGNHTLSSMLDNQHTILDMRAPSAGADYRNLSLHLTRNGRLQAAVSFAGASDQKLATVYSQPVRWAPGEWHHVALSWSPASRCVEGVCEGSGGVCSDDTACGGETGTRLRLYIDGVVVGEVLEARDVLTPDFEDTKVSLLASGRGSASSGARGELRIDEFVTFNEALSPAEVARVHAAGAQGHGIQRIAGARTALTLSAASDGFGISQLADVADCSVKTMGTPSGELWQLELERSDSPGVVHILSNRSVLKANVRAELTGESVHLMWRGIPLPTPQGVFPAAGEMVDVDVWLDRSSSATDFEMRIAVSLESEMWTLSEVLFPRVRRLVPPRSRESALVMPISSGVRLLSPAERNYRMSLEGIHVYPGRFWTMPWVGMEFGERASAVYLGAHDPLATVKRLQVCSHQATDGYCYGPNTRGLSGAGAELVLIPEHIGTPGNDLSLAPGAWDWPVTLGVTDGGWYGLARRYKAFADQAPWTAAGPIATRSDWPAWLAGTHLISPHTEHGIDTVLALDSMIGGAGETLWHMTSWDPGQIAPCCGTPNAARQNNNMPFVQSLAPSTRSAIERARARGLAITPYYETTEIDRIQQIYDGVSCRVADDLTLDPGDPWYGTPVRDPRSVAVVDRAGVPAGCQALTSVCAGSVAGSCMYTTNPAVPGYQALFAPDTPGNPLNAFATGAGQAYEDVQGLYLDVISTMPPQLSYGANFGLSGHEHPSGGGSWWVDGQRAVIGNIRATFRERLPQQDNPGFYSEDFSDPYVGSLEAFLMYHAFLGCSTWDPDCDVEDIPLAQAVYHEYAQFLGIYTVLRIGSEWIEACPEGASCGEGSFERAWIKQALALSWGNVPGFMAGLMPPLSATLDAEQQSRLRNLVAVHRDFSWALVEGEMLAPPVVRLAGGAKVPRRATRIAVAGDDTLDNTLVHPAVTASAWRAKSSTPRELVLVASLDATTDHEVVVSLEDAPQGATWQASRLDAAGERMGLAAGTVAEGTTVPLTVTPYDVIVIEITPQGGR